VPKYRMGGSPIRWLWLLVMASLAVGMSGNLPCETAGQRPDFRDGSS
jgi:hypothetical protein